MSERPTVTLRRWEDHGAHWRLVALTRDRAVVELCTCHGESVDRLESTDPELLDLLRRRPSSESP